MIELSESVRQWFLESGWQPNREVEVPGIVPRTHPAWGILKTFGGLTLLERNPVPDFDPIEEFQFAAFPPQTSAAKTWTALLRSYMFF